MVLKINETHYDGYSVNNPGYIVQRVETENVVLRIEAGMNFGGDSPVKTVNSKVGNIVLNHDDVGAAPADHSHSVSDLDVTGEADGTQFLRDDGSWATPDGGTAASHESIQVAGDVTLPVDKIVLTLRVDEASTITVPVAPDGTVITIHVTHGWEHISWAEDISVTGDSSTTETWVVLVRTEGAWQALVSGSPAPGGSGGGVIVGRGHPSDPTDLDGYPMDPIEPVSGTMYLDADHQSNTLYLAVTRPWYTHQAAWTRIFSGGASQDPIVVSSNDHGSEKIMTVPEDAPAGIAIFKLPQIQEVTIMLPIAADVADGDVLMSFEFTNDPDGWALRDLILPIMFYPIGVFLGESMHTVALMGDPNNPVLRFFAGTGSLPTEGDILTGRSIGLSRERVE